MSAAPVPARQVAFDVVRRAFERDSWVDRAFRGAADRAGLEGRERAQGQRLAYGAVQRRATSDHLIAELAGRDPAELDPPVVAALRVGLYELLFADAVPDHAAVDQAVELAKRAGARRGAGLVNAVLRRAARERAELLASFDDSDPAGAALLHSAPEWLAELWWEEFGADGARSLLAACNEPAELALRVNTLAAAPDELLDGLREAGVAADRSDAAPPLAPREMLVIDGPLRGPLAQRMRAGELVPQSRGSAAVVELLDPRPGERVLDLCAGPGIKTGQIAARLENRGEIVSVEQDSRRAAEITETMGRLGASCVRVVEADAAEPDADLGEGYDRVLLDPPCSDLGTLASRPDARWRKSPALIDRLAPIQARILERAAAALRPGGVLVYSTCTLSRRENEARIEELLATVGGVPRLRLDDLGAEFPELASTHNPSTLQIRPDRDRTTGFFVSRVRRDD